MEGSFSKYILCEEVFFELMAALTYSLKKYINFNTKKYITKTMRRMKEIGELFYFLQNDLHNSFLAI
jgi:hypothetical protein